jgi:hypothetical protein
MNVPAWLTLFMAVPCLKRLVAGLLPLRAVLAPRAVHVGFMVDKVALGQVFFSESFGFPLSVLFHRYSIFTNISFGGWTRGPLAAQFHRDVVLH